MIKKLFIRVRDVAGVFPKHIIKRTNQLFSLLVLTTAVGIMVFAGYKMYISFASGSGNILYSVMLLFVFLKVECHGFRSKLEILFCMGEHAVYWQNRAESKSRHCGGHLCIVYILVLLTSSMGGAIRSKIQKALFHLRQAQLYYLDDGPSGILWRSLIINKFGKS